MSALAIFGAGLSGRAARMLALARGHTVTLFDEAGGGDQAVFGPPQLRGFDRFIFSPGFAAAHPWRLLAEQSGKPVQSELSFAAEFWEGQLIGITGTNGKTTLTRLLAQAWQQAGKHAVAAGNIGQPLSELVLTTEQPAAALAVCEISSFQAELSQGLRLDALLWTNFAEDHLDRYPSMSAYFMAKAELLKCLGPAAVCVLGPQVVPWLEELHVPCRSAQIAAAGCHLNRELQPDSVFKRTPNTENFALAATYWHCLGLPPAALLLAANQFEPSAYRLAVVAEKDGVCYWNDSKATNFHATLAAVQAMPRPIIWIGGGRPKGGQIEAFAAALAQRIDAAVLYGEAGPQLLAALQGQLAQVQLVPEFEHAVRVASRLAAACRPSHVLCSPGFASFDQFASYRMRGKSFDSIVLGL